MNLEALRDYCLRKAGRVTEEFPFGEEVLVFKLGGRIFLLARLDEHPSAINLKCDPARALELRERHPAVRPGYHMNKKHWNTVVLDGSLRADEVCAMIDHSYELVARSLPSGKRDRSPGRAERLSRRASSRASGRPGKGGGGR